MKYIITILRILIASIFFYTFIKKILDISKFESVLLKSTLIEEYQINALLIGIPAIELGTVILLLTKKFYLGLYLSFFLVLTYTIYLIVLNNFSFYEGCSCGGIFYNLSYSEHLIVNAILLILSLISIILYNRKK